MATNELKKPSPFDITELTDPISNMKSPMPLRFYKDVWDHFSVSTWNWQTGETSWQRS